MFLQRIRMDKHLVEEVFGKEMETTRQSVLAAAWWRAMSNDEHKVPIFAFFLWGARLTTHSPSLCRQSRKRWSMGLHTGCTRTAHRPLRPHPHRTPQQAWAGPSTSASSPGWGRVPCDQDRVIRERGRGGQQVPAAVSGEVVSLVLWDILYFLLGVYIPPYVSPKLFFSLLTYKYLQPAQPAQPPPPCLPAYLLPRLS
jgi:hypothetical protein